MPKMKTHSGAKKRFRATATGKLRGRSAFTSHILEKKSAKRKRQLGRPSVISAHDRKRVEILLGVKHKARRSRAGQARPEAEQPGQSTGPDAPRRNSK
jgi:large subunit ribosomal protein L35